MGTLINQNVAYNHDFRGFRFHWLFGWYINQPQWGYDGDIMEIYGGNVITEYYQRKLGSNTSELRTNRILRLEMMKGGTSSNNT